MKVDDFKINKVIVTLDKEGEKKDQKKLQKTAGKLSKQFKNIRSFNNDLIRNQLTNLFKKYTNVLVPEPKNVQGTLVGEKLMNLYIELLEKENTSTAGFDVSYNNGFALDLIYNNHNLFADLFDLQFNISLKKNDLAVLLKLLNQIEFLNKSHEIELKTGYKENPFVGVGLLTEINDYLKINNNVSILKKGGEYKLDNFHGVKYSNIDDIYYPTKGVHGNIGFKTFESILLDLNIWYPLYKNIVLGLKPNLLTKDFYKKDKFENDIYIQFPVTRNKDLVTDIVYKKDIIEIQINLKTKMGILNIPIIKINTKPKVKFSINRIKNSTANFTKKIKMKVKNVKAPKLQKFKLSKIKNIKLPKFKKNKNRKEKSESDIEFGLNVSQVKIKQPYIL